MYHKTTRFLLLFLLFLCAGTLVHAEEERQTPRCEVTSRLCLLEQIVREGAEIDKKAWRDQTYREAAKTYAFDGEFQNAVALIGKIETPDTKALTIRGIGMEQAHHNLSQEKLDERFATLRAEAEKIDHPPSYAIALTYIAMSQAFAKDNDGAWKTAADMENDALRHKAYGETAEIQAEMGDFKSAKISIERIESTAFRNKAYSIVSKILTDKALYDDAYEAALLISNPYKRTLAIQYILDVQSYKAEAEKLKQ